MRDDSGGGGEDRSSVGANGGRETWASEIIFSDFVVGIVDALVIAGAAGVSGVALEARNLLGTKPGTVSRWSLDAARRRVAVLVSRVSSPSSLEIE